jgi:hypothetical protein
MSAGLFANTPLKEGKTDISLRIPPQCAAMHNAWAGIIEAKDGLVVGEVKAVW